MGNSMSLQGHSAPANSSAPDVEPLHGPARLPLALKHATSAHAAAAAAAHAAAEAPTPLANPANTSSKLTTPTIKQSPQQEHNPKPAASLSSSSRSSSVVSLSSRGFTNDDTMPWRGSPHGSHGSMPDLVDAKSDKSEGHGELLNQAAAVVL
jgi:hypothetical protein